MARLTPIESNPSNAIPYTITSISFHNDLVAKIDEEKKRIGVKSRSKMISMILEEYFKEPL